MIRLTGMFSLVGLVLLVAACGGGATKSGLAVELGEWFVDPAISQVPNGQVTFTAINNGAVEHEFIVLKTDLAPDALVLSGDQVDEDASGTVIGRIEKGDLGPGTRANVTFRLDPARYVLFCNIPDHYSSGQMAGFRVFRLEF